MRDEELAGADFSAWRVAMSGAERVDPGVVADFTARLAPYGFDSRAITPCYGMAETTLAVTGVRPGLGARIVRPAGPVDTGAPVTVSGTGTLGADRPEEPAGWIASCGRPVPGTAVEIVDDDGTPLPDGTFGEIRVSGTSVADGYETADPAADQAFGDDGLRTGDAGFLLDGELYVIGRIGDSLKVRGRKVHAEDLEAALVSVPGVPPGRCAVALGDRDGRPGAVIVVEAPGDGWLEAVRGALRSALDASVALTVVRARRGTIPRTSSGKPRRRLLWRQAGEGTLAGDVLHRTHGPYDPTEPTAPRLDGAAHMSVTTPGSYSTSPRRPRDRRRAARPTRQLRCSVPPLGTPAVGRRPGRPGPGRGDLAVPHALLARTDARLARRAGGGRGHGDAHAGRADRRAALGGRPDLPVHPAGRRGPPRAVLPDLSRGRLPDGPGRGRGGRRLPEVFTPVLTRATDAVRKDPEDRESWYRALIYYHLITEGVLAATALRTTRFLARLLKLQALEEGLTNVTRDESRHVSYGLRAAQDGSPTGSPR